MNAELFTSVAARLRPRMLSIATSFDADSAEDAVQEALMRLWATWDQLPAPADAERLAVRLTKHACIDEFRRRQKRQTVALQVVETTRAAAMTDTTDEATLQRAIDRAVEALPPAERRLWMMHAEARMNSQQIAAATAIEVRSVSTMLSSARRHICETLKRGGLL
jgi:RNA polymerase sigma-70 factor (ECF subfamily)